MAYSPDEQRVLELQYRTIERDNALRNCAVLRAEHKKLQSGLAAARALRDELAEALHESLEFEPFLTERVAGIEALLARHAEAKEKEKAG